MRIVRENTQKALRIGPDTLSSQLILALLIVEKAENKLVIAGYIPYLTQCLAPSSTQISTFESIKNASLRSTSI